jgi:tetratricopeptide (TPR) repeat protein
MRWRRVSWAGLICACILLVFLAVSPSAWAYRVVGIEEPGDLASELGWRDVLAAIQRNLKQLGYYKGPIDGRYGDATRNAVDSYRRRNGIIDNETIWPAVLIHMQVLGEAIRVQKSLKAARIRQIDVAKTQLLKHSAARDLLASVPQKESADPTHNPSICFAAPTLRCLLDEALESIRGVTRDRYRNWALQDMIVVLAEAGMAEPMKDAIRRLTDARLVLVALREAVAAMVAAGRIEGAEDTLELMPDGADRVRALLVVAKGWAGQGDRSKASEVLARVSIELDSITDARLESKLKADIAVVYAKIGNIDQARAILMELATDNTPKEGKLEADKISAIVNAYVEFGDLDRALAILRKASPDIAPRKGRIAVTSAFAAKGEIKAALDMAKEIVSPRYRVVALCNAARKLAERGDIESARTALTSAETSVPAIEGEFANDFAWSCLAETYDLIGDKKTAQKSLKHVEGADLKARSLWRMWAARRATAQSGDVEGLKSQAIDATKAADTFKRAAIWSEASVMAFRVGEKDVSKDYLGNAIAVVSGMQTRWWRARALSRIAKTVIFLESPVGAR